jgi:hypothetical protein
MSAQFVDALKGYEFFLNSRGKASREEINDNLIALGRRRISPRTYRHYGHLIMHGFESYIPINKFDVFQSLGRLQMAADRRRYPRQRSDLECQISRNRKKWTKARLIDRSSVGFGLETTSVFPVRQGTQVWIRLAGYRDIPAILVWRKHAEENSRIGVRAIEFIARYRKKEEERLVFRLTGIFRISKSIDGKLEWEEFERVVGKTDQLLDATESLIYATAEHASVDIELARPIVHTIRYGSPGETQIKIDFGVADIIRTVLEKVQFWGMEKRRQQLGNVNLEIEAVRNAVNLRKELAEQGISDEVANEIMGPMIKVLGIQELPPGIFSREGLERGILDDRLLPAAVELVAGDNPDIEIDVKSEEPQL